MGITRREMLGRGALLAAAAAIPAAGFAGQAAKSHDAAAAATTPLTKALFEALVGSSFEVGTNASHQYLTLLAVEDLPNQETVSAGLFAKNPPTAAASAATSGFMLSFSGGSKLLKQGTYSFKHASTGSFEIFIVPAGNRQMHYNAVFNFF